MDHNQLFLHIHKFLLSHSLMKIENTFSLVKKLREPRPQLSKLEPFQRANQLTIKGNFFDRKKVKITGENYFISPSHQAVSNAILF